MNRIEKKFARLKSLNKKVLIAFITAGYPDLEISEKIACVLEKNGVDVIELGMPFSDPIADGPTIQKSSYVSLKNGMNLKKFFGLVKNLRKKISTPLVMMSYYNPILKYGLENFARQAAYVGLDGVIVPDLPPEEACDFRRCLKINGISLIFLISPLTEEKRIKKIAKLSSGFIYYVSLTGVTGARSILPDDLLRNVRKIKQLTAKPVCVGFGISQPEQVKAVLQSADGVIVGSAIIKIIEQNKKNKQLLSKVGSFISGLSKAK